MKNHYWLVSLRVWNLNHYDIFSMTVDSAENYVNKKAMDSCKDAVAKKVNCHPEKVIVVSVSYLGHMNAEEFNG